MSHAAAIRRLFVRRNGNGPDLLAAVAESERRYRDLFENATAPIVTCDLDDRITDANEAFVRLVGYPREELIGSNLASYMEPGASERLQEQLRRKLSGDSEVTRYEQILIGRDGRRRVLEVESRLVFEAGLAVGAQGIARDVTSEREAAHELERMVEQNRWQATHDPLTGLPNRRSFRDLATARLAEGGRSALLLFDLDRFKEINDTLGHRYGDALLVQLAQRLRNRLRAEDLVGRLGGDEFAILVEADGAGLEAATAATVRRVEQVLAEPFIVEGLPLRAEASIGIACHPADGETLDLLLQHADIALYRAKRSAASHSFYEPERDRQDAARLALLGELEGALGRGELVLHYQPKMDLYTRRVEAVEALVRWHHPRRGVLAPSEFIEAVERTTLIGPLTLYVVERALAQIRRWRLEGLDLDVSVNLSGQNLSDPALSQQVSALLSRYPGAAERLVFEITESALTHDPERARQTLHELRDLGTRVALDDFGSGYTSLSFLSEYPLDRIKIDRAFIDHFEHDLARQSIVRACITLAHDLGLKVVGEGIETEASERLLVQFGCDLGQGFHYSEAMPADGLADWIRRESAAPVTAA